MTRARWAILAVGLPVVLALIAFGRCTPGSTGTVIYLADQNQVGYSVGFSVPAAQRSGPGAQQQR